MTLVISPLTTAAIISSFDADTTLTVSADFDITDLATFFDDSALTSAGTGTGSLAGSGDDLFDLLIGDNTLLSAFADGNVIGSPGSVDGYYLSSAEFYFENTGTADFTGSLTFDYALFATIFTASIDEAALAFSSLVIGFERFNNEGDTLTDAILIDQVIEFDSSLNGVGTFSDTITNVATSTFTIGVDESILYYFELDAAGFADTSRVTTVSEPTTLAIFAMAIMCFGIRQYSNNRHSPLPEKTGYTNNYIGT